MTSTERDEYLSENEALLLALVELRFITETEAIGAFLALAESPEPFRNRAPEERIHLALKGCR